jgi:hypothetical protein
MDPDGKITRVMESQHNPWAVNYLKSIGKYQPRMVSVDAEEYPSSVYDEMYQLGWLRVALVNLSANNRVITVNQNLSGPSPNRKQIEALKDLALKYGVDEIRNDTKRTRIEIDESMFPKEFNRHTLGSCMAAAAHAVDYLLKRGITNFKVVEGWVSLYPDQEEEDWSAHTWIEFPNGKKFDPTKKQWAEWGFDPAEVKYTNKIHKVYTPKEYQDVCKRQPNEAVLLKEAKLRGEWWVDETGQATFADVDVGDASHESIVRDYLTREFLEYFDIDVSNKEYAGSLSDYIAEIKQHLIDEKIIITGYDVDKYNNDPARYMLKVLESREVIKDKKQLSLAFFIAYDGPSQGDPREYALIYWKWKRIKQNWIETWNLTSEDVKIMYRGLWDAYGEELEGDEEGKPTFNIEVRSNNTRYYDVPIEAMKSANPMDLYQYRNKTDLEEWKKYSGVSGDDPSILNARTSFRKKYGMPEDDLWRGPHSGAEIDLLLRGVKPAAIINTDEGKRKIQPYIDSGQFISAIDDSGDLIVVKKDEPYRLKKLLQLSNAFYKTIGKKSEYDEPRKLKLYHRALGILLGYSKEDIQKFIQSQNL